MPTATENRRASSRKKEALHPAPPEQNDPELEALVREIIGRLADKWTMLVLEAAQNTADCDSRVWVSSSEE